MEWREGGSLAGIYSQKMKVHKYPQIRVAVNRDKGKTDIYIFYEINEPGQKYYWYELENFKQDIAKVIAIKLAEIQTG